MCACAPIALFAYNRPDHLRRTMDALSANHLAVASELNVFCDGAKEDASDAERQRVADVLQLARQSIPFKRIKVHESTVNKGLARAITDGVSLLVAQHGKVIVLEDDMVTSRFFLQYMNDALRVYEGDARVACISGYCYPVKRRLPHTFFLRGADCWGWATWSRAWELFNPNGAELLQAIEGGGHQSAFNMDDAYDYLGMLRDQIGGRNDSWAIRWYASAFLAGKLCLYPGRSLVDNIGLDGTGRHCGLSSRLHAGVYQQPIQCGGIDVVENRGARSAFAAYLKSVSIGQDSGVIPSLLTKARQGLRKSADWLTGRSQAVCS